MAARGQTPDPKRPELVWNVERRDIPAINWRARLAAGGGRIWIGTDQDGGRLFRKEGGEWSSERVGPPGALRAFTIDTDPGGTLWIAPFYPEHDDGSPRSPYRHPLRIQRFDGRRWQEEEAPGIWPQAMDMISADEGWIAGNHGHFLHRTAGGWQRETLVGDASRHIDKNFLAIQMRNREEGWAVGHRGLVARRRHGRWEDVAVPPEITRETLFDLDLTDDGGLWVVGTHGLIAHRKGESWQIFRPTTLELMAIDMISPSDGWAVGWGGTLLRFDGRTWKPQPHPVPSSDFHDILMVSENEGWIVGQKIILHGQAGSSAWHPPRFQDMSRHSAYPMAGKASQQSGLLDVDGDGDLDLITKEGENLALYLKEEPHGFGPPSDLLRFGRASRESSSLMAWAAGDVDGDGYPDLVLWGTPFHLQLLRNSGRGVFDRATRLSLQAPPSRGDRLSLFDLDGDGQLDFSMFRADGLPLGSGRNRGASRFEISRRFPSERLALIIAWGDLDGDRDLDAVLRENDRLLVLRNDGRGRMVEETGEGLELPRFWLGPPQGILVDLDRDGDLDLLLLGRELAVLVNDGKARFHRDRELVPHLELNTLGQSFVTAGDLNHDGFPEILVQTSRDFQATLRLLSRSSTHQPYRDVIRGTGLEGLSGENALLADLDGDGDLDLLLHRQAGSLVLENRQNDANFLKVRLRGDRSHRDARGAQVWVYETGGEPPLLLGYQQLGAGFPPGEHPNLEELHFGLGSGAEERRFLVEALFPSGRRVIEPGVRSGQTLTLNESPPGLRQGILGWRWARRAALAAHWPWEAGKLAFVIAALLLWRGPLARRFDARLFVPGKGLAAAILCTYVFAAGELAPERGFVPQAGQLVGLSALLAFLTALDARLGRWRNRRYFGPFYLEKTLGQGGMGVVHRARHAVTRRTVALKVLHPRWGDREDLRLRFLREAQVLTRVEHPNVVRVLETGAVGDRGYISMELLKGMTLRAYLDREGRLAPEVAVELLLAACGALAHVHSLGLVHGDVKSANFFLLEPDDLARSVEQGWRPRIQLMDFGLAQSLDAPLASFDGTPAYMAPERLRGEPLEPRSDLYSLGVVAYEMLTGHLPFEETAEAPLLLRLQSGDFSPLRERRPEISAPLAELVARLLARSAAKRPTAEELAAGLRGLRRGGRVEPVEPSPAVASAPAPLPPRPSPEEPPPPLPAWQNLYRAARDGFAEGRTIEGQVLLVECLAELGETLETMSQEEREAYCRHHTEIASALTLHRHWSQGAGAAP